MTELNPILLLPYTRQELRPKQGGGSSPEPLVDIGTAFRQEVASRLDGLAAVADAHNATPERPLPVKIRLHERALAKSNRPYALLNAHALPVEAVDRIGELVVGATGSNLRSLASTVEGATSKADRYAISTLAAIESWDLSDIFGVEDLEAAAALVEQARTSGRHLKITLFPWMEMHLSPETMIETDHEGQLQAIVPAVKELAQSYVRDANVELYSAMVATSRPVIYAMPTELTTVQALISIPGVRKIGIADEFTTGLDSQPEFYSPVRPFASTEMRERSTDVPVVGVLDTGVSAGHLDPWVADRVTYVVGAERDPGHGTFAAGLVVDSRGLNDGDGSFPDDTAAIVDAQVMPGGGISEAFLHERVVEVVTDPRMGHVKVWNCSFGSRRVGTPEYGTFAQELDAISAEQGVLFVIAAGNYTDGPERGWPPAAGSALEDRISSPAEAVRALTVGARAHRGGRVSAGAPASYTQRGPNFAAHIKPELCHWAGDVSATGELDGFGVRSLVPSGELAESVGTSFAAPQVSSIAANTWQILEQSGAVQQVTPELVKGLLVHSAALADTSTEAEYRDYYGWGVPPESAEVLGNGAGSFTTVHEVVLTPGSTWLKAPFPVPDCLITDGNKFRGEVFLTIAYSPPIDPAFGAEAVRYEVDGGFGSMMMSPKGTLEFKSITPGERPNSELWEASQIAEGKWAPIKTYRHRYPRGKAGGDWALRLSLTERVSNEIGREQLVYAILTFRGLEDGMPVYRNGVEAVQRLSYESRVMVPSGRIRLQAE
ncbi:S8 family peptidase [Rathayibacter sp. YIM 133350]|uniref:S8 family peptidase n=1 Tax=Rathayibacter sp. YIM 133350 TaxID=3131992 RepID=UPI00307F0A2F